MHLSNITSIAIALSLIFILFRDIGTPLILSNKPRRVKTALPMIRQTDARIISVAAQADRPLRLFSLDSIILLVSTSHISSVWLAGLL